MRTFPRSARLSGALLASAIALCAAYVHLSGDQESAQAAAPPPTGLRGGGAGPSEIAVPVEAVRALRGTLVTTVSATGQAEAAQKAIVTAVVAGRLAELPVRESGSVAGGRTIAVVDPAEYALAVREAEAAVRDAAARHRELTLFDDRITDPALRAQREQIARARSGLDGAEIRLQRARLDLQRTRLAAPFAGRIANLKVVPGQWLRPGDEVMTVLDLDPVRVEVQVLEGEVARLAPGRPARVSLAAFPDERFTGRVESINPLVESGTRTARVTVLIPNPSGRILPGMFARVHIDARQYHDRTLVPRSAALERDRRPVVFVLENGQAKWRYVELGLSNDSLVELVSTPDTDSIRPGDLVLTRGHHTLTHDARVRRVEVPREEAP